MANFAVPISQMSRGTIEATAAALFIPLGFDPNFLAIFNIDGDAMLFWVKGMPDASGFKTVGAGTTAYISTGGITPVENNDTDITATYTGPGAVLGTDADINASGETLWYVAF